MRINIVFASEQSQGQLEVLAQWLAKVIECPTSESFYEPAEHKWQIGRGNNWFLYTKDGGASWTLAQRYHNVQKMADVRLKLREAFGDSVTLTDIMH